MYIYIYMYFTWNKVRPPRGELFESSNPEHLVFFISSLANFPRFFANSRDPSSQRVTREAPRRVMRLSTVETCPFHSDIPSLLCSLFSRPLHVRAPANFSYVQQFWTERGTARLTSCKFLGISRISVEPDAVYKVYIRASGAFVTLTIFGWHATDWNFVFTWTFFTVWLRCFTLDFANDAWLIRHCNNYYLCFDDHDDTVSRENEFRGKKKK